MVGIVLLVLAAFLILIAAGVTRLGRSIYRSAKRLALDAAVPRATIANPEGIDRVHARAARAGRRVNAAGRHALLAFGVALMVLPWVGIVALAGLVLSLFDSFSHDSFSKGRVLRVRNRAQLPEVASGRTWHHDAELVFDAPPPAAERAVVGELWLLSARMEHASIAAFSQLSIHLLALGAPARLVAETQRAAMDEVVHARACFSLASALLGEPKTAGPIAALATADAAAGGAPDLVRLALGSLVDGCLAEGLAADVAAAGAAAAADSTLRKTLAMIAKDEARHAELGWSVLAWCIAEGGEPVRARVAERTARLERELTPRLPDLAGTDVAVLRRYGVIDQDALGGLAAARIAATQVRARALLADDVRLAA